MCRALAAGLLLHVAQCRWIQTSASQYIRAPIGVAYSAYRDLRRMPEWSPVSRVDMDPATGESEWHLGYRGVEVSWTARIITDEFPRVLRWESTSGPRNHGEVVFVPEGDEACTMALTMHYVIPGFISKLVQAGVVQEFITRRCLWPTLRQFGEVIEAESCAAVGAPAAAQAAER